MERPVSESKGSLKAKQTLYSCAGDIAVRRAQNNALPITCVQGTSIVKIHPDGTREEIGSVEPDFKPKGRFFRLPANEN